MKKLTVFLTTLLLVSVIHPAAAQTCNLSGGIVDGGRTWHIVQVHFTGLSGRDNTTFMVSDLDTDENGTPAWTRQQLYSTRQPHYRELLATALTAIASGKSVWIRTDSRTCIIDTVVLREEALP